MDSVREGISGFHHHPWSLLWSSPKPRPRAHETENLNIGELQSITSTQEKSESDDGQPVSKKERWQLRSPPKEKY